MFYKIHYQRIIQFIIWVIRLVLSQLFVSNKSSHLNKSDFKILTRKHRSLQYIHTTPNNPSLLFVFYYTFRFLRCGLNLSKHGNDIFLFIYTSIFDLLELSFVTHDCCLLYIIHLQLYSSFFISSNFFPYHPPKKYDFQYVPL